MTTVKLPDAVWGRLATVADVRGVDVPDLLVAALTEILKPRNRREHIVFLAQAGYTDARICEATGELRQYVGDVRRKAGISANRQPRTDTEEAA